MEIQGFRKYISKGRAGVPKVCIRKNGQIGFNSPAVAKYDLDVFDFVVLHISEKKDRVAIQFTNNKADSGLIKLQTRPGSFAFSARNFLGVHDIDWSKTINLDFLWDPKDKVAIFKIPENNHG